MSPSSSALMPHAEGHADVPHAEALAAALRNWCAEQALPITLHVFDALASTNTWLIEQGAVPEHQMTAALAIHQTAGRGRRGAQWQSPPASGLCLSVARTFAQVPLEPAHLTMALGVSIAEALTRAGVPDLALKWPNDLVYAGRKLGGLLVETRTLPDGRFFVVAGIGINRQLPAEFQLDEAGWSKGAVDLARIGIPMSLLTLTQWVLPAVTDVLQRYTGDDTDAIVRAFESRQWRPAP
ncbi:MAG: biotin--[acetyl-CoA-carboxylase] ligase [Pseudomonadota bacterium]